MSLTILPRNTSAAAKSRARARLEAIIEDPITVVALVGGEGDDAERAVEIATARASVKPNIRRVVWIPDKSVLGPAQRASYFRGGARLSVVGLSDEVAARVSSARAKVRLFVERAFLKGESQ